MLKQAIPERHADNNLAKNGSFETEEKFPAPAPSRNIDVVAAAVIDGNKFRRTAAVLRIIC